MTNLERSTMTLDEINAMPHSVTYLGEATPEWRDTPCDHWHVTLRKKEYDSMTGKPVPGDPTTFDYYTGLGLRKSKNPIPKPKLTDVLYCLIYDAEALTQTFDEWCDCCGYSNDSIKALNAYNACHANGRKLVAALGKATYEQVALALQDY